MIIDVPALTPVTIPEAEPTDALALLLVHVPPVIRSLSIIVDPGQTFKVPVIAGGTASTVTTKVAVQPVPKA